MTFNVGDIVKMTSAQDGKLIDQEGIIKGMEDGYACVEFPLPFNGGHTCIKRCCKDNHGWDVEYKKLILSNGTIEQEFEMLRGIL